MSKPRTVTLTMHQIGALCRKHILDNRTVFMVADDDVITNTLFKIDPYDISVELTVERHEPEEA